MLRLAGWLVIAALALVAHWLDRDAWRAACACAVLGVLLLGAPRALRATFALLVLIAAVLLASGGVPRLLDALPALISGCVAWLFARTLIGTRRPLIARAIAALDGEQQLDDPATRRYARTLTMLWAAYQALLALLAGALAVQAALRADTLPHWLPGPRVFGAVVLPLAVLALLLCEFAARRALLPHAPRHRLIAFLRDLVRAWPKLLDDG